MRASTAARAATTATPEALRYVIVCDDCQQELGEVGSEAYRPQFDPRGNDPYIR